MKLFQAWKVRKEVGHGGIVPAGWQMAWYEPRRRVGVYYPAPLHWIVRALREFRYRLRIAWRAPRLEGAQFFEMQRTHRERQRLAEEYARGYLTGWRECFHACVEAIEEEMADFEQAWDVGALLTEGSNKPPGPSN
jgi:hypothetical protein